MSSSLPQYDLCVLFSRSLMRGLCAVTRLTHQQKIVPKYAEEVGTASKKAIKVLPSFTGFTAPIAHMLL